MADNELNQLYEAIKNDDCETFYSLTKNTRLASTCFGRFPVLSLMYLYGSDKLVKNFEKNLLEISAYAFADETEESYLLFKEKAKKCLRLYVDKGAVVSPLEMLLILGRGAHFWHIYPSVAKNMTIKNNVNVICNMIYGAPPQKKDGRLAAPVLPLKRKNRLLATLALLMSGVFVLGSVFGMIFGVATNGKSQNTPYVVAGENSLVQALNAAQERYYAARGEGKKSKTYIKLTKDITVNDLSGFTEHLFADIDGNGYTITVNQTLTKSLFGYIVGSVTDTTFVLTVDATIKDYTGVFATVSMQDAFVKNCTFVVGGKISVEQNFEYSSDYYPVGVAIGANGGKVVGCNVTASDLTVTGYEHANFVVGGIAGVNEGEITDSTASIAASVDTVDFGGIAAFNQSAGKISNCRSELKSVCVTTSAEDWSINVGGACYSNLAEISSCSVSGNLTVESLAATGVLVGGVTVYNYGVLSECSNKADVGIKTVATSVYVGGVAVFNNEENDDYSDGKIVDSHADGKIDVNLVGENNRLCVIGGVCAQNSAEMKNNYFDGKITTNATDTAKIGGVAAGLSARVASNPTGYLAENYYTDDSYAGVAFEFDADGRITSLDKADGIIFCTEEQLKTKEVYGQ